MSISEQIAKNQEEAEELFSAIQEIALNLEQKKAECIQLTSENGYCFNSLILISNYLDQLNEDMSKGSQEVALLNSRLEEVKEVCTTQKV